MMTNGLFISGDVHGEIRLLVWTLCERYKVRDANLIVAGDFGVGFGKPGSMKHQYEYIKKKLEKYNINIYVVRGNHDDPSWFDGEHNFDRLHFLPDHKVTEISGLTVYPIGGAISTDREWRLQEQKKIKTKIWWEGEPVKKVDTYPVKVDIMVSHTAPIHFNPIPMRTDSMSVELYDEILEERRYLTEVSKEINWNRWYYGHFHNHYDWSYADKLAKGLGIMEFIEVKKEEG